MPQWPKSLPKYNRVLALRNIPITPSDRYDPSDWSQSNRAQIIAQCKEARINIFNNYDLTILTGELAHFHTTLRCRRSLCAAIISSYFLRRWHCYYFNYHRFFSWIIHQSPVRPLVARYWVASTKSILRFNAMLWIFFHNASSIITLFIGVAIISLCLDTIRFNGPARLSRCVTEHATMFIELLLHRDCIPKWISFFNFLILFGFTRIKQKD
jgi:hypothetical protein